MNVNVLIRPGLSPMDRGDIEDAIIDALGDGAEFVGGGTFFGEVVESDFQLEVSDASGVQEVYEVCAGVLKEFAFSQPTELNITIGEDSFEVPATVRG